ncbi:hypothetical protein ColKHC_09952 [Colletotrichum higginsianum]|nr:hypothetical protein ColKHC_09952 [Colletotrichum higginsianum]
MATTFHLFPLLPWELRIRIWKLISTPRTVMAWAHDYGRPHPPVPSVVQTCRESRHHSGYERLFIEDRPPFYYIWANLTIDTIHIFEHRLPSQFAGKHRIRYLCLELVHQVDLDNEPFRDGWVGVYSNALIDYVAVRSMVVVSFNDVSAWGGHVHLYPWPCPLSRVMLVQDGFEKQISAQELMDSLTPKT